MDYHSSSPESRRRQALWHWALGVGFIGLILQALFHLEWLPDQISRWLTDEAGSGASIFGLSLLAGSLLGSAALAYLSVRWALGHWRRVYWLMLWLPAGSLLLGAVIYAVIPSLSIKDTVGNPVGDPGGTDVVLWVCWTLVYLCVTILLGCGGALGLRPGPPPRIPGEPQRSGSSRLCRKTHGGTVVSPVVGRDGRPTASIWRFPTEPKTAAPTPREHAYKAVHGSEPGVCGTYLFLAIAGSLIVYYASLVPFHYHARTWHSALEQFATLRWLSLDVNRRADWLANLALFVPLGYLWSAAWGLDRRRKLHLLRVLPCIIIFLGALIVAIEFTQLWFAPRTVSLNDMAAEAVGMILGIALWFIGGKPITRQWRQMIDAGGQEVGRRRLLQLYVVALLVYMAMPMDVILSLGEFQQKVAQGRVVLIPFTYAYDGLVDVLGRLIKPIVLFVPVGILFRLGWERGGRLGSVPGGGAGRGVWGTIVLTCVLATVMELVQLCLYSGKSDITDILLACIGGWLGATIASRWMADDGSILVGRNLSPQARRPPALLLGCLYVLVLIVMLWYPIHLNWDAKLIMHRLAMFWNLPFTLYYYTGEWQALTNVTVLMLLFFPLGALMRWAEVHPSWAGRGRLAVLVLAVGLCIESGQAVIVHDVIYLSPQQVVDGSLAPGLGIAGGQSVNVSDPQLSKGMQLLEGPFPDVTDVLAYGSGAAAGWMIMGFFLPRRRCDKNEEC